MGFDVEYPGSAIMSWEDRPCTDRQREAIKNALDHLRSLGAAGDNAAKDITSEEPYTKGESMTMGEASELIDQIDEAIHDNR